jgi:hypothetical protein
LNVGWFRPGASNIVRLASSKTQRNVEEKELEKSVKTFWARRCPLINEQRLRF